MPSAIKVNIAQPCSQNWEQMTASAKGHFCLSCQKTVVDFSIMSDPDILHYMEHATSSVCGRFTDNQLNKVLRSAAADSKITPRKTFWQLLIAGTLFSYQAKSQIKPAQLPTVTQVAPIRDSVSLDEYMYQVIDGTTKQPLSGATIIAGYIKTTSNDQGVFSIKALPPKITISYIGYKTREFLLEEELLPKNIELETSIDQLDEVSITAPALVTCDRITMGGASYVRVLTPFHNFVRNLNQWIPNPAVKVFPNPVNRGQSLNIKFSLEKPGNYALKVFAADGRLVHAQSLQITSAKQPFQLPVSAGFAAGIYWLHVQNKSENEKAHEIKIVIK